MTYEVKGIKREDVRLIVRESVQETLGGLGFDLSRKSDIQADLLYLRAQRQRMEDSRHILRKVVLSTLVGGVLVMMLERLF